MMRFEKEKTNTENASSPKPIEAAVSKIEAALRLAVGPTHLPGSSMHRRLPN